MDPAALAAALEASALGAWMRAGWTYPIVNVLHLLGLTLLVGPILLLDLRLLGFGAAFPLSATARALTPFAVAGLLLMLVSGVALFAADASALIGNRVMQIKLLLVALGIGNAIAFRRVSARSFGGWERAVPTAARALAALSILIWLSALIAGRLIAYV